MAVRSTQLPRRLGCPRHRMVPELQNILSLSRGSAAGVWSILLAAGRPDGVLAEPEPANGAAGEQLGACKHSVFTLEEM